MGVTLKKCLVLFLVFFGAVGWAADKQKLAVYKLSFKNLRADQLSEISNAVTIEFRKYGEYDVIDWTSLKEMIANVQEQKNFSVLAKDGSKTECLEDRCFMELGGRLGVELNFIGSVAQIGNRYSVTFKLQDVEKLAVISIVQTQIKGDIGNILDTLPSMVARLLGKTVASVSAENTKFIDREISIEKTATVQVPLAPVIVKFESNPAGATVMLDSKLLCTKTPCAKAIAKSVHNISFEMEAYQAHQFEFKAEVSGQIVTGVPRPNFGNLTFTSNKTGVPLKVNGEPRGNTPQTLHLDAGVVLLEMGGDHCFSSVQSQIAIQAGSDKVIHKEVPPRQASLLLEAKEGDDDVVVDVLVDGLKVGQTPWSGTVPVCAQIKVGEQDLQLKLNEGQHVHEVVKVVKNLFVDDRDGQVYKTVKIGNQVWMAQNLNYKIADRKGSWCYDNIKKNCLVYGRLYDWKTAVNACPKGWHLPGDLDFIKIQIDGKSLKTGNWGGDDSKGFSVLPAGSLGRFPNEFGDLGSASYFWTSYELEANEARFVLLERNSDDVVRLNFPKHLGLSVRCVKND